LAVFIILACSDPIGYPKNIRAYYDDDYTGLGFPDVQITKNIPAKTQTISCGYAVIEMLAIWNNDPTITEDSLLRQNDGKISTAMGSGFLNEMTRQFPEWKITRYINQTNTKMLEKIYASLENDFPVPVEFAAKDPSGKWTLHFGLVTAIENNEIVVQNPYGYEEKYTVQDFIRAARYEVYESMEWYFKAGFNMGLFNENTFYILTLK
jgi:hypothetical protein